MKFSSRDISAVSSQPSTSILNFRTLHRYVPTLSGSWTLIIFQFLANMVALGKVIESNSQLAQAYPEGLVAVFVGATSGIGEIALRNFVQHTSKPRVYIVGRSQEACDRIDIDLKNINPGGAYIFMRSDLSLLRNVDDVCKEIMAKEPTINVLFMSQGTLNMNKSKFSTISACWLSLFAVVSSTLGWLFISYKRQQTNTHQKPRKKVSII